MSEHETRLPELVLRPRRFRVPLDHRGERDGELELFAREVVAVDRAADELPYLVFLQGGPGFGAPKPAGRTGWIRRATEEYRVLLLDQRGTGSSSPVSFQSLAGLSPQEAAERLTFFRADSIVRDCERVRRALIGDEPWSVLGQSFGGFCAVHYLSAAPEGLREAFITGGLPPLSLTAGEVYRRTYPIVRRKNQRYHQRYPEDAVRVRRMVEHLRDHEVRLPTGDPLTPRRFRQLGLHLGFSDGFEVLHHLLEEPWVNGEPSYTFLRGFEGALHFDTNPIFSILHEACYTQGAASRWAAARVLDEFPEFHEEADPLLFTGEMIYPWMFEEVGTLRPLREAAEILAAKEDWPVLYDPEVLAHNEVPCAAAVYAEDMYVERGESERTADAIRGLRPWVTNEYEHNGLRADGEAVLGQLIDRVRGRV